MLPKRENSTTDGALVPTENPYRLDQEAVKEAAAAYVVARMRYHVGEMHEVGKLGISRLNSEARLHLRTFIESFDSLCLRHWEMHRWYPLVLFNTINRSVSISVRHPIDDMRDAEARQRLELERMK